MAKAALAQIELALATVREGGHALSAAYFAEALPKARALVERLNKH
jgi:hypothetical protein